MKKHFSTWFLSLIILTLFLNGCNKYDLDLNDFFKENEQTSTEEYIKENGSGQENSIPEKETGPEVLPPDSLRILDTNTYERMHFTYRNVKWYFVLESAKGTDIDSTIDFGNMNSLVNKYTTSQGKSYYIQKKDNYSKDSTIKTFEFTLDYETFKKIAENEYRELKDFIPAIKGIEIPVNVSFKDSNGNTVANSFIIILTAPIPQLKKSSLFIDNTSGNYIYKFAIPDELFIKDYYDNYFNLYFYIDYIDKINAESYMSALFNKINQTFVFNVNEDKLKFVNYQNESKLTFVDGSKGYYNENHIFYIDTGITAKENSINCDCGISSVNGNNSQYYNTLTGLKPVPKIISPIKKVQNDNELSIETLESNQFVKNVEFKIPATAIDMTDDQHPVEEQIDQILKISYTVWNGTKEADNYIKNENQILKSITITANPGEIISIEMEKGISFVEFHIETVQENSNYVSNTDKTFIFEIKGGERFTFVGNNETQIQLGTESHPYTALENIITEELFNFSESIYIYIKDELPATDPEFIIPENKTAIIVPTGNTNISGNTNIKMSTPITLSDSKLSIASGFNLSECEITATGTSSIISSQIIESTINITDSSSLSVQNSTVNSSTVKLGVGSIFVIKEEASLSDNQFNMTLSDENSTSRIHFETESFFINSNTITAEPEYFNSTDFYNKPSVITVDPSINIAFNTEFVSKWNIPQYEEKMFKIAGDEEKSKNPNYVLGSIVEDINKTVSKFESVQGISVVTFTIEETTSKISFTIDQSASETKAYIDGIEVELTGNSVLISNLEKGNHSLTFTAIVDGVIHSCDYFFSK